MEQIIEYRAPSWRRAMRWLVAHPIFGALLWNPVWKINSRLWGHPRGRTVNAPWLNGGDDVWSGISSNGVFSIFGWGWLTGFAVEVRGGVTHYLRGPNGRPCRRIRKFGRITATRK